MDQSRPVHSSVKDGIPDDLCSVKYSSVDDAVAIIRSLGRDTELAKLDLKDAYRIIPVTPMTTIFWEFRGKAGFILIEPFRLASARPQRYLPRCG